MIKTDLMNTVRKFEVGELDIARLNYVMLTLIPKEAEATELKKNSGLLSLLTVV